MKIRKEFQIFFVILVMLLVVSYYFDYQISEGLYNRSSLICRSIHVFAQLPAYLLMAFFSAGIFNSRSRDYSAYSMLSAAGGFLLTAVFGFLCGYVFLYNLGLYSITLIMAIDIGIFVCCYMVTKLICDHDALALRKASRLGLSSFALILFITLIGTAFFDRIPFRRLDGTVNVFEPWYLSGFSFEPTGFLNRSFPSITMALTADILLINLVPEFARRFRDRKTILSMISFSWILLVAISQLILGYSYLSDILIGLLIGCLSILLFSIIYYRKPKVNSSENLS
ncbi:phosphatase PAP2 family protein [Traorella massiliensis]|uniref:phosphatase PAP2 family protein n=1 Tax=Traorella massiliensis TaxID=1903263 RepID=UPI0023564496|nr:phosphatase PAP2 family protein [Traorella massiliensis]